MNFSIRLSASLAALAIASVAAPAFAADAAEADAAAVGTSDTGLTDIVVTATKRETNLQKTPISIAVMGTEEIKKRHVQSLYDLADGAIPSLRVATFEARQSALTIGIRGIVPLDANQPAREQGVGIYIDGIYLGRQHGLNAALFDVERIEVLKGPQGTLFGRNTEGGALSIVTKAPTGEFGGRMSAGVGNYGARTGEAHINLPKVMGVSLKLDGIIQHQDATTADTYAGSTGWNYYNRKGGRVTGEIKPVDGLTVDLSYDVAEDANTPFYSQLLNYNPNNCSGTTVTAACSLPGTAFTSFTGSVKALPPGIVVNGDTRMAVGDVPVPQQPSVDKTHGYTSMIKYKISPEIELRSITGWRGVNATQYDNSGGYHRVPLVTYSAACTTAAPCAFSRYSLADLHQTQFSQEFQAVGSIGSVDYVAGLYYFNEHVSDDAATPSSVGIVYNSPTSASFVNLYQTGATANFCTGATSVNTGSAVAGCNIDRASEVWSKSYAAFGQATWNANDAVHVTVGGRFTHDTKRGVLHWSRSVNYDVNTAAATAAGYKPLDKAWDRFNPMATIAYDVNSDVHVYAKYATGYRAGGASSRTQDYRAFNPEDVKSYEVGLKADFWNRRARFNLAGYVMNRTGSQVDLSTIQPFNGGSFNNLVTFNAPGTTKIRGIEADLTVKPFEGLTLNASYAYTYTDIPLVPVTYSTVDASGNVVSVAGVPQTTTVLQKFYVVFTPRNAASASMDYELPVGGAGAALRLHLDANYSQSTQTFDQFATHNDASLVVNGRLALADIPMGAAGQKLTVSAWARNLMNTQYVYRRDPSNSLAAVQTSTPFVGSISNVLGDYGNFNTPRTCGVEAAVSF
jgi:iron complex outermembrane receptor protein